MPNQFKIYVDRSNYAISTRCWFVCFFVIFFSEASVAESTEPDIYEDNDVRVRLIHRTPEQLAAFYMGRGFKRQALNKIQETCFVTAVINNKNIDVLWLELDNWMFSRDGKSIARINRDYWIKQWQEIDLPLNHRSTFSWTLLPEVRDLRVQEVVGGNVVIPKQTDPFDLTLRFKTGFDKDGKEKKIIFRHIMCGGNK